MILHHLFSQHTQQLSNIRSTSVFYQTPAGTLQIFMNPHGIYKSVFVDEKDQHAATQCVDVSKLHLQGTEFQIKVWKALLAIPHGTTCTYQDLAHALGQPSAWRAVANAVAANPIAYFVPCHRVIRKDGTLGGYAWGIERKKTLLAAENLAA